MPVFQTIACIVDTCICRQQGQLQVRGASWAYRGIAPADNVAAESNKGAEPHTPALVDGVAGANWLAGGASAATGCMGTPHEYRLPDRDHALLRLLAELPGCTPSEIFGTAADVLTGRTVGLRFMLLYVQNCTRLTSLVEAWPKLALLCRLALPGTAVTPPLLLLLLHAWSRRAGSLGEASPLRRRGRERREAIDLFETLVRATTSCVSHTPPVSAHQPVLKAVADAADLPAIHPYSAAWEGEAPGVLALLTLERCMMPLIRLLCSHTPKRIEQ
jgi:hypothetical protein